MELDVKTWKTKKFERLEEEKSQICKCGKQATIIKVCFKTKTYYCKICYAKTQIASRIHRLEMAAKTESDRRNRPKPNSKEIRKRLKNHRNIRSCVKFGYWKGYK